MSTATDRRVYCLRCLEEQAELSLSDLVGLLGVSEATVRRDLALLEGRGLLARTRGGARRLPPPSLVARTFEQKSAAMRAEKEALARAAAELVQPGMTLALDSGTTIWRLAAHLAGKAPLVVLTSALAVMETLGAVPGMTLHMSGGRFRLENLDCVGARALEAFDNLRADMAFISGDGFIPGRGLYSDDEDSAALGARLARCAEKVVVLVDHSKIRRQGAYRILAADEVDVLITDAGISRETRRVLAASTGDLRVAGAGKKERT